MNHQEAILRARARSLAQPPDTSAQAEPDHLVFTAGGARIAVPIERVAEILPPGPTVRVPPRGHNLAGVRAGRGDPVVVLDIAAAIGIGATDRVSVDRFVVVLDHPTAPLGLAAGELVGLQRLESLVPAPAGTSLVRGMAEGGVLALDADAVLNADDLAAGHPGDGFSASGADEEVGAW